MAETRLGDVRQCDAFGIHRGAAPSSKIVECPSDDAGAFVEVAFGARPPGEAVRTDTEYPRPNAVPLSVAALQDFLDRRRHGDTAAPASLRTGLYACRRKLDHPGLEFDLVPPQAADLGQPAQCEGE